jgi:hypothetical protein
VARPNGSYARLHQMQLFESKADAGELKPYDSGTGRAVADRQKAESSR